MQPKNLVIDVDGVLTNGQMIYSAITKEYKIFGPDDMDAIKWLVDLTKINVILVSADHRGFDISQRRARDMKLPIHLIPSKDRWKHIRDELKLNLDETIYIGDGWYDKDNFQYFSYSMCPIDALDITKMYAKHIICRNGGDRCVAQACNDIYNKFFKE